ncbi:MAG: valine--pyruvate transaminase [bacterium]
MNTTKFAAKFTEKSGILELMDDLGKAMKNANPNTCMLGGGNPAHIPEVQQLFQNEMQEIIADQKRFNSMIGNYTTPQGDLEVIQAFVKYLQKLSGWKISTNNVIILNSSQLGFFMLFNLLAGDTIDNKQNKILFPIVPEYIGYADQGLSDFFISEKPLIEKLGEHHFKYHINFEMLKVDQDIKALCVSRPTNPTGNVISDEDVVKLQKLAKNNGSYLIIDNAYGAPFPNILFKETEMLWEENMIHSFSLSKIGLPGTRTSFLVASEEIIQKLSSINAILSLASNNIGPELIKNLLIKNDLNTLSKELITPFYQKKSRKALSYFEKYMDHNLPYYVHESEGALFLWLWLENFPINTYELYERLKKRGVIVVPGKYFFPGYKSPWQHKDECIRLTYSQDDAKVEQGIRIIAEEVGKGYGE